MTTTETALFFVEAINSGDAHRMAELMTEDHTFVDSDGREHSGRDRMRVGWEKYFRMVPDFTIHVDRTVAQGNMVALFGAGEGTFDQDGELKTENHWSVPAAWRVIVRNGKVALWHLYVNPEPMREIYDRINPEKD